MVLEKCQGTMHTTVSGSTFYFTPSNESHPGGLSWKDCIYTLYSRLLFITNIFKPEPRNT